MKDDTTPRAAYPATPERVRISGGSMVREPGPLSSDGDRRKRNEQVLVRLSTEELQDARALASANGITVAALLRAGLTLLHTTEVSR